MQREDFIFTIGYQGNTALVDSQAKKKYSRLSALELAKQGLYKAAFSSAVFDQNVPDMEEILKLYNSASERKYSSVEDLKRLFGVYPLMDPDTKVKML